MPRGPLTQDDVEDRMWQTSGKDPDSYRSAAADYEAWASEPHPDDEVTAASLLVSAGEQLAFAGDHHGALSLFERAVKDGGAVRPDARGYLIGALLRLGRDDEADTAAAALLRSRPRNPAVYEHVGEQYEMSGRLDEANRWMSSGVFRLLRADDVADSEVLLLMLGRRRVRLAIGLDQDEYDVMAHDLFSGHREDDDA